MSHLATFIGVSVLLTGASTLAAVSVASGATPCQGQTPTITGSPGAQVMGTEGADVIDSSGAIRVDALGGDDVVCVTGDSARVYVLAGAGDDSINTELASVYTTVDLGPGSDQLAGGPGRELVQAYNDPAGGTDVVDTGAGRDIAEVGLGPGVAGPDRIDLGAGEDKLTTSGPTAEAHFDGGPGDDTMTYEDRLNQADWLFDNAQGLATRDGSRSQPGPGSTTSTSSWARAALRRGAGAESVDAFLGGRVDLRLSGGHDRAWLSMFATPDSTFDGGGGRDKVRVSGLGNGHTLHVDLARGFAESTRGSSTKLVRFNRFEDADAWGGDVTIIGTRGPNRLVAWAGVLACSGAEVPTI